MPRNSRGTQDARRAALKSILRRRRPRTQQNLVDALEEKGFHITQSSLSRDLMHLGAQKVDGAYKLAAEGDSQEDAGQLYPTLGELRPFVRSVVPAGPNLLVVSTRPGLAQTVALALDSMCMPEVVGTIAGDDIVFVATPQRRAQRGLERRFELLLADQSD
ncbi:MAG: transcriptional regulator of arginine metabolism [Pseudohongiellaceae bacterium]|jgi:transcriptional regulator of arginine metabolism